MHERKFAVLYCRISKNTSQQDESDSIVNQKILLQRVAAQNGLEHTRFFIDDSAILGPSQKVLIKEAFI